MDTGASELTIAVILVLGILWLAVLVPPILRARNQQSRSDSVGDFHYRLGMLGQTNGTKRDLPLGTSVQRPMFAPSGTARMSPTQKRRRDVLLVLLGVAAATLFLAVLTRATPLFALHVLADAALGGYIYLLIQFKHRVYEQQSKVRYLGSGAPRFPAYPFGELGQQMASEPTGPRLVPLRRTASN